jgi:hypothetical protein
VIKKPHACRECENLDNADNGNDRQPKVRGVESFYDHRNLSLPGCPFLRQPAAKWDKGRCRLCRWQLLMTAKGRPLSDVPSAGLESTPRTLQRHPVRFEIHQSLVTAESTKPLTDLTENRLEPSGRRLTRFCESGPDRSMSVENSRKPHMPLQYLLKVQEQGRPAI